MDKLKPIQGLFFRDFNTAYFPEILKEIYRDKIYAPFIQGRKDLTILDIGANVGLFTHYAYPFARKIYSVEPSLEHFETLTFMCNFNQMFDKVTAIKKAVSIKDSKMTLYHNKNTTMFSLKESVSDLSGSEEVETVRLDTLLASIGEKEIDFMKLDVEGAEAEIIGHESFQKIAPRIKSLVVELHQWNGFNQSQLFNTLLDYGYEVASIPAEAMLLGAKRP